MQKLGSYFSVAVITGLVGTTLWAVVPDIGLLVETGGWFAVFGQFAAVFSTLGLGLLLLALCVTAGLAPVLVYFLLTNSSGDTLHDAGTRLYRVADGIWKVAWRAAMLIRRALP